MELALHINQMESQLETMETRLTAMDEKMGETNRIVATTNDMVKEMHTIVIGTEHTRNDSMLAKVTRLEDKVKDLETDKTKRDTNIKTYLGVATVVGAVLWAIIQGILKYIALLAK